MLNIDIGETRPTVKALLDHLEEFEHFCMGKIKLTPDKFRQLNEKLSIGAVLVIGKRRYYTNAKGRNLVWKSTDNKEYDLGPIHKSNIMRDFPGFHANSSRSLGGDMVQKNTTIDTPYKRGNLSMVTMKDGTTGIGPNYRIALRNASLKMHLKSNFNHYSLANIWGRIWGNA